MILEVSVPMQPVIEMKNGVEMSRKEIASVVTKEPKKQIEIAGTKVSLPSGSHSDWMSAAGISLMIMAM